MHPKRTRSQADRQTRPAIGLHVIVPRVPPTPRKGIFDLYWRFAAERQAIFERRVSGQLGPWTDDPILATFKFCNVYRAADRESQFLIRNVAYAEDIQTPEDRLFAIVAYRLFSRADTWSSIRLSLQRSPRISDLSNGSLERILNDLRRRGSKLYTAAFILCAADAYHRGAKHLNHLSLLHHMFVKDRAADAILAARSLGNIYELLHAYPLLGDFMAYQICIDLNYSALINFSENDFTKAGPGARRGVMKAIENPGDYSLEDMILWMVERQTEEFAARGLAFGGLWGRRLHAIDCQGLFCELDKYCREAAPELVSARSRIKARFRPSGRPIALFFPPKWRINDRVPRKLVLGAQGALLPP